jgi:glycosyltransferase involved in cell wall biosynthesis
MWPEIKKILPDATLNIYCNLDQEWVNGVAPEQIKEIKTTINQPGITIYGWVSKQELYNAWQNAEYWLYPCIFEETFCLTALEAAISRTCIITNGLAALSETAQHGITVEGDPFTQEWQLRTLSKLKWISSNDNIRNTLLNKNYNWALEMSWKTQTDKLINLIK